MTSLLMICVLWQSRLCYLVELNERKIRWEASALDNRVYFSKLPQTPYRDARQQPFTLPLHISRRPPRPYESSAYRNEVPEASPLLFVSQTSPNESQASNPLALSDLCYNRWQYANVKTVLTG